MDALDRKCIEYKARCLAIKVTTLIVSIAAAIITAIYFYPRETVIAGAILLVSIIVMVAIYILYVIIFDHAEEHYTKIRRKD